MLLKTRDTSLCQTEISIQLFILAMLKHLLRRKLLYNFQFQKFDKTSKESFQFDHKIEILNVLTSRNNFEFAAAAAYSKKEFQNSTNLTAFEKRSLVIAGIFFHLISFFLYSSTL